MGSALTALESQCEAVDESLLERMEAAKVTGQRATHIKQTSGLALAQLASELRRAAQYTACLRTKMNQIELRQKNASRLECRCATEVAKLVSVLGNSGRVEQAATAAEHSNNIVRAATSRISRLATESRKRLREVALVGHCNKQRCIDTAEPPLSEQSTSTGADASMVTVEHRDQPTVKVEHIETPAEQAAAAARAAAQVAAKLEGAGCKVQAEMVAKWKRMLEGDINSQADLQDAANAARQLAAQLRGHRAYEAETSSQERAACQEQIAASAGNSEGSGTGGAEESKLDVLCGMAGCNDSGSAACLADQSSVTGKRHSISAGCHDSVSEPE